MSTQWYTLQRGGYALIASGGLLFALIVWSLFLNTETNPNAAAPALILLINVLAYLLLLLGLPAIYAMQPPTDRVGQAGFLCIAVGIGLNTIDILLATVNVNLPGFVFWAFLILEMFGYLLVGWVTARPSSSFFSRMPPTTPQQPRVFPSWVGWTLFAAGAVTLLIGPGYSLILLLFALIGFGITIVRATRANIAVPTDEASLDASSVEPQA